MRPSSTAHDAIWARGLDSRVTTPARDCGGCVGAGRRGVGALSGNTVSCTEAFGMNAPGKVISRPSGPFDEEQARARADLLNSPEFAAYVDYCSPAP